MADKARDMARTAVFLDRDGTLNVDKGYIGDPEEVELIDGAARAVGMINGSGARAVVITNQSGVGRGYYTEADLGRVNDRFIRLMTEGGARIDGIYHCPHRPGDGCGCRKPEPGLIERAAADLSVSAGASYVVGDKASDIALARRAGARAVLVLTGVGKSQLPLCDPPPDYVARDVLAAVEWILDDLGASPAGRPYTRSKCRC